MEISTIIYIILTSLFFYLYLYSLENNKKYDRDYDSTITPILFIIFFSLLIKLIYIFY
jgi:hypothetical protein